MANDLATSVMPDFRQPHFGNTMSTLVGANLDLSATYLMTIAALSLGIECKVVRTYKRQGADTESDKKPLPVVVEYTSGKNTAVYWGSASEKSMASKMASVTSSKVHTRRIFAGADIMTPLGALVWADNMTALETMADAKIERVLLKPNTGSLSRGLVPNITIDEARAHVLKNPETNFIIEQYVVGTEFRIYLAGGVAAQCLAKLPDSVVGNGKSTLNQLVQRRLQRQMTNPDCVPKKRSYEAIVGHLTSAGFDLGSIPESGHRIALSSTLVPSFRDGVSELKKVPDSMQELGKKISKTLEIDSGAIDFIGTPEHNYYVLEVNSKPGISPSSFPINAPWNLRLPEALLRSSFPDHVDKLRKIKRYDFMALIKDYRSQHFVTSFNVSDYVEFA